MVGIPSSDHRIVSVDGWACDVCGQPVNGQTDADGIPLNEGESVRHLGDAEQSDTGVRHQSDLCCTVYDAQCICWSDCRCRCAGCTCGPLIRRSA